VLLLRLADATRETAHAAARRTREVVGLGVPPGLSSGWLLDALAVLGEEVPHAAITLTEAISTDQLRMVREGRLDLGLVHEQPVGSLRGIRLFDQPFGVAVRPGHPLAGRPGCRLRDLDGVRILAHGRQQVPVAHDRLVVAAHDAGVVPLWQFAQFSEHALACAEATRSDAVLLTEHSAARLLPAWPWLPVVEPQLDLVTWLAWQSSTRTVVDQVARRLGRM
jgi:DNA-binding transcriptional LysR family regulator